MKNVLIAVIIILIITLMVQLIYYNLYKKNNENINIINTEINNQNEDEIVLNGIEELELKYIGNINIELLEEKLYNFLNVDLKKIYDMTKLKSINQILQTYDLNTQTINSMNIYSREDLLDISSQILNVGNIKGVVCKDIQLDFSKYNQNEDGYTTFNVIYTYSNNSTIKMKVHFANNNTLNPNIMFAKQEE